MCLQGTSRLWILPLWRSLNLIWFGDVEMPEGHHDMLVWHLDVVGPDLVERTPERETAGIEIAKASRSATFYGSDRRRRLEECLSLNR